MKLMREEMPHRVCPSHTFTLHDFSCLQPTSAQKYYMESSRKKQFIHFKLCTVLRCARKCRSVRLCPTRDVTHPFVQHPPCGLSPPTPCPLATWQAPRLSDRLSQCHSACVQVTLIFLNNGPKHKSSDGGISDMPEKL